MGIILKGLTAAAAVFGAKTADDKYLGGTVQNVTSKVASNVYNNFTKNAAHGTTQNGAPNGAPSPEKKDDDGFDLLKMAGIGGGTLGAGWFLKNMLSGAKSSDNKDDSGISFGSTMVMLAAAALVYMNWDTIKNTFEKVTQGASDLKDQAVASVSQEADPLGYTLSM